MKLTNSVGTLARKASYGMKLDLCSNVRKSDFFDAWLELYESPSLIKFCTPDVGTNARRRDQVRLAFDLWNALFADYEPSPAEEERQISFDFERGNREDRRRLRA